MNKNIRYATPIAEVVFFGSDDTVTDPIADGDNDVSIYPVKADGGINT